MLIGQVACQDSGVVPDTPDHPGSQCSQQWTRMEQTDLQVTAPAELFAPEEWSHEQIGHVGRHNVCQDIRADGEPRYQSLEQRATEQEQGIKPGEEVVGPAAAQMQTQTSVGKSFMGDPAANDDGSQSRCTGPRQKQPLKQRACRWKVEQPGRDPQNPGKAKGNEYVGDDASGGGRMHRMCGPLQGDSHLLFVWDVDRCLFSSLSLLRRSPVFHGSLLYVERE